MHSVKSINNVNIRLTSERWEHISQNHPECAGFFFDVLEAVQNPQRIYRGKNQESIAIKKISASDKLLVVVYREVDENDGFITKRTNWLQQRSLIWP